MRGAIFSVMGAALLSAGCAPAFQQARLAKPRYYLGLIRVADVGEGAGLRALDVQTLGMGWDGGAFIGWRHGQYAFAESGECQILIFVRTKLDQSALERFRSLGGQTCIADFASQR